MRTKNSRSLVMEGGSWNSRMARSLELRGLILVEETVWSRNFTVETPKEDFDGLMMIPHCWKRSKSNRW